MGDWVAFDRDQVRVVAAGEAGFSVCYPAGGCRPRRDRAERLGIGHPGERMPPTA